MKCLLIGKRNSLPIPPEHMLKLFQASKDYPNTVKKGIIEGIYTFSEGGGAGIYEVESPQHMYDLLVNYPLYAFFTWEVKPLCDWNTSHNTLIEMIKKRG